jgi:hypothetical protein
MFNGIINALQKAEQFIGAKEAGATSPIEKVNAAAGGGKIVEIPEGLVAGAGTQAEANVTNGWFGPGQPLNPVAPKDVAGRMLDYPVSYNTNTRPRSYSAVSFDELRALADGYDLLRLVIETRKDQIEGYEFDIVTAAGKTVSPERLKAVKDFFQSPDKEHDWGSWVRMIIEDLLVIDAVAVYPRKTRGGKLYSLDLVDAGTIKRVIDQFGRTPTPEQGAAYQQVLKGLPAVDYTRDELIYSMRNPRTNRIYGYSPVEQVIVTVSIALRRQISQLQYYTEGNIPEAIAGVPDTWSMETLKNFQVYWDTMLEGDTAQRRKMKFVPLDASKIHFPKAEIMKDAYDEWLARIICFAFSIPPTALIKEVNRSVAETSSENALREGLVPMLNWLKKFFDRLIRVEYGEPDIEFVWKTNKELSAVDQAQVDKIYVDAGVDSADEIRERLGKKPMTPETRAAINASRQPQFGQPQSTNVTSITERKGTA